MASDDTAGCFARDNGWLIDGNGGWAEPGGDVRIMWHRFSFAALALFSFAGNAQASIADCKNLYVVSVHFRLDDTRPQVVFSETPGGSGVRTLAIFPAMGLTDRAYDQLFAALLTAKSRQSPVDVTTGGASQCSLGGEYLTGITIK